MSESEMSSKYIYLSVMHIVHIEKMFYDRILLDNSGQYALLILSLAERFVHNLKINVDLKGHNGYNSF